MTQPPAGTPDETPDETPDFRAKPVSPSGERPPPSYGEPTSPYVSPPAAPPGYGYAPYAPHPGAAGYPFAQPHNGATVGLVLGIVSVVCSLLAVVTCFTIVGALTGPFAIVLGARARKEMAQSPGRWNNPGVATAAFVTGLVGSVLGVLALALAALVFGLFLRVAGP